MPVWSLRINTMDINMKIRKMMINDYNEIYDLGSPAKEWGSMTWMIRKVGSPVFLPEILLPVSLQRKTVGLSVSLGRATTDGVVIFIIRRYIPIVESKELARRL